MHLEQRESGWFVVQGETRGPFPSRRHADYASRSLDMLGFTLIRIGMYWHHVNHARELLTSGWSNRQGAERNRYGYGKQPGHLEGMANRYSQYKELNPMCLSETGRIVTFNKKGEDDKLPFRD